MSRRFFKRIFSDLLSFFYPGFCAGCGKELSYNEEVLCGACLNRLAYTGYEQWEENPVRAQFGGRIPLYRAWSLLHFRQEGITQKLLHHLKYDKRPEIGVFLGKCIARRALETDCLSDVDYMVPVPLHPKKLKKRGYNQSLCIIEGICALTGLPSLPRLLYKKEMTESQTKKDKEARWKNVKDTFALNAAEVRRIADEHPEGIVHLLLVDDVITTGATLESCCRELLKIPRVRISVLSAASPA